MSSSPTPAFRATLTEYGRPAGIRRGVRNQRAGDGTRSSRSWSRGAAAAARWSASRASPAGGLPVPRLSASKAAAISYLESLRVEERAQGIKVVTLCPGYIATPLTAKNPYKMPFLLQPDDAAARMLRVIAAGRKFAVVPWQMAIVGRLLRCLPRWIYDRVLAGKKRKPRVPDQRTPACWLARSASAHRIPSSLGPPRSVRACSAWRRVA
jgi:NAD(P)-dependent dehydrogenase (short-subunit alcohol dehydrogenase family)